MCVNDVLCTGARPLFFLDYVAVGRLDPDTVAQLVEGIADGCRQAGAALLGGETAEHPGVMADDDLDVAGFCVGEVARDRLVDGRRVEAGDAIVGLAASGPHSNGFSLIRRVLGDADPDPDLLVPTRIYAPEVAALLERGRRARDGARHRRRHRRQPAARAARRRAAPGSTRSDGRSRPGWRGWRGAGVAREELRRVFNCGIGYLVVVPPAQATQAIAAAAGARHARRGRSAR